MSSISTNAGADLPPPGAGAGTEDQPKFDGQRGKVFKLAFVQMAITIFTLGIGRFWMTTRLRRHYWSSIRIGGDPLEYTGKPLELLLGFLMALVIIAVYLIVVNLALTFVGLSVFQGNPLALQLPVLALLPLAFWAQYRARRYLFARTRWRGVRFGLMPGAWGYMWRAMGLGLLTLFTFGFLYPMMQMRLESYVTERMRYGHLAFRQEGRWGDLLKSWLWVWAPLAAFVLFAIVMASTGGINAPSPGMITILAVALYFWVVFAALRHGIKSVNYLHTNKVLGGETRFSMELDHWKVIGIYILGGIAISVISGLVALLLGILTSAALMIAGENPSVLNQIMSGDAAILGSLAAVFIAGSIYVLIIPVYVALVHAFIVNPLVIALVDAVRIINIDATERAKQREHDEQAEAGGFADALDVDMGGAF